MSLWDNGTIEFDDAYVGGPTVGKKRSRGTEKAKVFAAVSLDGRGNPRYAKMQVTRNIKQASVKKFAHAAFTQGSTIHSDGYRSYVPALEGYTQSTSPTIPIPVCSTGCTSSSVTPRRLSWVLIMVCPRSTSKHTLTNIASASAAVTLALAFWTV